MVNLGRYGEDLAVDFLKKKKYKIIERNFQKRYGEIDIVAIDPSASSGQVHSRKVQTLVFVEVKTRTTSEFGDPLESITPWKLRSVVKTAQYYKLTHPKLPELMRIDAVCITLCNGEEKKIEHVENISF